MIYDTIAAPATGMVNSGIGIIRVSGEDAVKIVGKIFPKIFSMKTHTIKYGFIIDGNDTVDEVMVTLMLKPYSYTRENVVEINCHGSSMNMNRILKLIMKYGARMAEPGEFTKRAFLNGRIDLTQAEAVMDLIQSKSEIALKNSVNQLRGNVCDIVKELRKEIIYQVAAIESVLDDPEHFILDELQEELSKKVNQIIEYLAYLLKSADDGRIIKDGINTVVVGKPNVGKSSFLNLLLGSERAIVTDIPGTTRDILEETVVISGIVLNVIDTAGIRSTDDIIEKIGIDKAKKYILDSDLIIYIVDTSVSLDENDMKIIEMIYDKQIIVLLNKSDLNIIVDEADFLREMVDRNYPHVDNSVNKKPVIIKSSMKEKKGLDLFKQAIEELFLSGSIKNENEILITNLRHKESFENAYESMLLVKESIKNGLPEDFYTIDMMNAYYNLGLIIGEQAGEDLVDEIFSKFCTGK